MTDKELILKKLAFIETCIRDLERLAQPSLIDSDIRERRFVEHTLQVAIQACQDVASHIVSAARLGEPETNQQLFELLLEGGWIDRDLSIVLRQAVGLRNVLVHGYATVDLAILRDVLENHLTDLSRFASEIRKRVQ